MTTSIYTIYKITNIVNNKYYIGTHKQPEEEPLYNYMGSGRAIRQAITKHGKDKFFKKITHIFDNPEDMYDMEAYIVDLEFINRRDTYNMNIGGHGGCATRSDVSRMKISEKAILRYSNNPHPRSGINHSTHSKKMMSINSKGENNGKFKGYYHTPWGVENSAYIQDKVSVASLIRYCKKSDSYITRRSFLTTKFLHNNYDEDIIGKTYRDIGFWFQEI